MSKVGYADAVIAQVTTLRNVSRAACLSSARGIIKALVCVVRRLSVRR